MTKFAFYLDLDGVMADYDAGIRARGFTPDPALNMSSHLISGTGNAKKREMYEHIKGTTYYAELPLLPGALDIYAKIADYRPTILTAAPKFDGNEDNYYLNPHWLGAAYHKRWWVENVLLPKAELHAKPFGKLFIEHLSMIKRTVRIEDERFICTTSSRKHEFMGRAKGKHQVLIDDRIANIEAWTKAGGIGILHVTPEETLKWIDEVITGEITYQI